MRPRPAALATYLCLLVAAAVVAGCSPGGGGHYPTAPVHGRITYQGKPIASAAVTFRHGGAPRYSSGRTDADGRFQLTTFQPGDGAIVGENSVTVVKRAAMNAAGAVDHSHAGEAEADAAFDRAASQSKASEIPVKYERPETSGLVRTVAEGDNEIEIELTD